MTIPYLPGIGDYAAKYLPQLGQNLQQIVKPELTLQRELQQLLMTNPEMVNQFIEMERATPGSTAKFGKAAQQYFSTADFTTTEKRRVAKEETGLAAAKEQLKELEYKTKERGRRDELLAGVMNDPNTPTKFKTWAQLKAYDVPNPEEFERGQLELDNSRMQNELLKLTAQDQNLAREPEFLKSLQKIKIQDLASNKVDPETVRKIFANPSLGKYYGDLLNAHQQEQMQRRLFNQQWEKEDARTVQEWQKSKDRMITARNNLTANIAKEPIKSGDDPRINQLNDLGSRLSNEFGEPLRLYKWDAPVWGRNKLVEITLTGDKPGMERTIGGGQLQAPPGMPYETAKTNFKSASPEERQVILQSPLAKQYPEFFKSIEADIKREEAQEKEPPKIKIPGVGMVTIMGDTRRR